MVKKIIGGVSVILLAIGGWLVFARLKNPDSVQTKTSIVRKGTLRIAFSLDGKTVLERRDLKFTVNGKVSHIGVKEGQVVKRGQYLMALDTRDVQKNLEKDLKEYLITRNTFEQTTRVTYPQGALNDTIKRALENTQYTLDKSVLDVEIQNIALKESYLYSPIDGVVSVLGIKEGEVTNTQNSASVVTIVQPGSLTFEAFAEDVDILKLNAQQTVNLHLDAIPNVTFPSTVDYISQLATVDANGLSTYKIRLSIPDEKGYNLLDGMVGQAQFITKEKSGVLIIPNTSVVRKNSVSTVVKHVGDRNIETNIETGFTDGKNVEVVSGLQEGDSIVIP